MNRLETTNGLLEDVTDKVSQLLAWAEADLEHSREQQFTADAADDEYRVTALRQALELLQGCGK